MQITLPVITLAGRRFTWVERHREADALLAAEGIAVPAIPPGGNTVTAHVVIRGQPALCTNQSGFPRELADDEQEVNGCALLILLDPSDDDRINRGLLEAALKQITA